MGLNRLVSTSRECPDGPREEAMWQSRREGEGREGEERKEWERVLKRRAKKGKSKYQVPGSCFSTPYFAGKPPQKPNEKDQGGGWAVKREK